MSDKNNNKSLVHHNGSTIKIDSYLAEIRRDMRSLPCQDSSRFCPQERVVNLIKEDVKRMVESQQSLYTHTIQPLLETQALLNEKQDRQQDSLNKIIESQHVITGQMQKGQQVSAQKDLNSAQEVANILTQLELINTKKETTEQTKDKIRDAIKWALTIVALSVSVYLGLSQIAQAI